MAIDGTEQEPTPVYCQAISGTGWDPQDPVSSILLPVGRPIPHQRAKI